MAYIRVKNTFLTVRKGLHLGTKADAERGPP